MQTPHHPLGQIIFIFEILAGKCTFWRQSKAQNPTGGSLVHTAAEEGTRPMLTTLSSKLLLLKHKKKTLSHFSYSFCKLKKTEQEMLGHWHRIYIKNKGKQFFPPVWFGICGAHCSRMSANLLLLQAVVFKNMAATKNKLRNFIPKWIFKITSITPIKTFQL